MRLVLIDTKKNTYTVYENKTVLGVFEPEEGVSVTLEDIEEIRLAEYKDKA